MPRVFITGSTDGQGRAAARALIAEGHEVVLHARPRERASAVGDLASGAAGVVVGDLASAVETRRLADQVNAIGRMDAVIHDAGAYATSDRSPTPEGHSTNLAVNTLAPYTISRWDTAPRPGWLSAMIPRRRSAGGTGTIGSRSAPRGKYQTLGFKTSSRPSSPK